jgi:hypothetical protein
MVALFVAISGTAVALPGTNTVNSGDIINGEVKTPDLDTNAVTTTRIAPGQVRNSDLRTDAVTSPKVTDETLTSSDLAANSVGSSEIATDAVNATEIANDSIDSGEIVDFGLSNQDVGVLFAQVNADGTLANSSGGVTASKIGTGTYQVDYGHNIQNCAYVTTQGESGVGGAGGAITGNTDRSGNAEATFTTTRTDANALADRAFQQIVVC